MRHDPHFSLAIGVLVLGLAGFLGLCLLSYKTTIHEQDSACIAAMAQELRMAREQHHD